MDDTANAADDERSVPRLHPRQLRRGGPYASQPSHTNLMASRSFDALDSSEPESAASSSALRRVRSYAADTAHAGSGSQEVLGDISNSSTRTRLKPFLDISKSPGAVDAEALENIPPPPHRLVSQPVSRHTPRQQPSKRNRIFGLKSSTHRRVDSSDSQRYVESLEAQVASLQTQLQSSSSPSLQRSNSNKLRALNAESKLLRQEVTEWERTFDHRVREHVEQYELVAGSLRARIRFLEKERDTKDQTIEALESDVAGKTDALSSVETANRALERRLDALLQQLHGPDRHPTVDIPCADASEAPNDSKTRAVPVTPASAKSRQSVYTVSSPLQSPLARHSSDASNLYDNPFDSGAESSKDSGYATELASEASDGYGLGDRSVNSAARPVSWTPTASGEALPRSRPSQRRMRRFYTGNAAQSLLLPAARSAGDAPLSAPLPMSGALQNSQAPPLTSPIRERFPVHSPTSSRGSISLEFRQRSATIDETGDPAKSDSRRRPNLEQTPRGPAIRHARTATDGSIMSPERSRHYAGFQFIRSDRESQGSDTTRPDTATQHSEPAGLDPTAPTAPILAPTSPLRFTFGPELNIDEVVANSHKQSQTPSRRLAPRSPVPSPRPARTRIGKVMDHVKHSFEANIYAARYMFASTWQDLAVARPVLEFRCWLVRVLLGRLRDRGTLFLVRRTAGRASTSNPAGLGLRVGVGSPVALGTPRPCGDERIEDEMIYDMFDDSEMILPPMAPPIHWLRFSMTMLCAVGVAIKDGPATLFPRGEGQRQAEQPPPPVHRRGESLLEYLLPAAARRL